MIRTVLVDDEPDCLDVLKQLLNKYCPEVDIVGEADSVQAALQVIEMSLPDLLLLDIAINNETAFDLLNQINAVNFQVIFITAWDQHAIQAFRYSAVDYLLKPVDGNDLHKAIEKATQKAQQHNILNHLKILQNNIDALQLAQQKIAIPTMTGLTFVYLKDIMRFEAKGDCTTIHVSNDERIVSTRSIKEYEDLLPGSFFYRVHNSHIINLNKVQKYHKGRGGQLYMEDGSCIEVAFRRREDFLKRLLK
jgi:two-component system, LytTR family, response regulator